MIWLFYCELVYVVSLVLFGDVDVVKRSLLCFAQHGSAGHHFSRMAEKSPCCQSPLSAANFNPYLPGDGGGGGGGGWV